MGGRGQGRSRRTSRAQARERLVEAAMRVDVPASSDVVIVGGGASGLVAAITCAERGRDVCLIERDLECGRTILATGNGRCNFSNALLDAALYHNADFVRAVTGNSWEHDITSFFADCGLAWIEEGEGRLYPRSRQAASVREVLIERARRARIHICCGREAIRVQATSRSVALEVSEPFADRCVRTITCESLVLATGHATTLDGLDVEAAPLTPVLCPIATSDPRLPLVDGRRAHARLTLTRGRVLVSEECGEVLFRPFGLSGICAFNLSRFARPGDIITIDLLYDLDDVTACERSTHTLFGLIDPHIARVLTESAGSAADALACARAWRMEVVGLAETERAQVMRGGIRVSDVSARTLCLASFPQVFLCGEALDVDGPCGGYNLAWAWKSGMVAGGTC